MRTAQHHRFLRWSLLGSLGLVPLGCDGDNVAECSDPQAKPELGLVSCEEGYLHRTNPVSCGPSDGADDQAALPLVDRVLACDSDPSACQAFRYGYCASGQAGPHCSSGCRTDDDCGPNAFCLCSGSAENAWGYCESATCGSNDDCEPGYRCASYSTGCGGGYACQTSRDECTSDGDCPSGLSCQPHLDDGHRVCAARSVCGRPFLVAQQVRVAPIVRRGDWLLT